MHSQPNAVIKCTHPDYLERDLSYRFDEFSTGARSELPSRGKKNWKGAFQGRPALFNQLLPVVRAHAQGKRPLAIGRIRSALRMFFRFLDQYETWANSVADIKSHLKIEVVDDLSPHLLLTWQAPPFAVSTAIGESPYGFVASIIASARAYQRLPAMWIPAIRRKKQGPADVPDEGSGRDLINELVTRFGQVLTRWQRADDLARRGRNLVDLFSNSPPTLSSRERAEMLRDCTEADLHATYRAYIAKSGSIPFNFREVLSQLGYSENHRDLPGWWPEYQADHPNAGSAVKVDDMLKGLYPSFEDTVITVLLLCGRTGWNQATALALDTSKDANWFCKYSEKLVWMFAYKHRSRDWQDTLSWVKKRTGPYQIVVRFMERVQPLKAAILNDPSTCAMPNLALRSPWIYILPRADARSVVRVLEPDHSDLKPVLKRVIESYNERNPQSPLSKIRPSDLRDVFAGAIYKKSGYSLFLTQVALGHKQSRTTFHYLRSRAFRNESEKSKNQLIVAVFNQIQVHRKLDLTLLRAEMEGYQLTDDDIRRLEEARKNKTYSGMYCSRPANPPAYIDPANPRDGSTICRQGHRCAACPNGRVFNDSFEYLARRCAELEWLKDTTPAALFENSSDSDDLQVLRATLQQWPEGQVQAAIQNWTDQIRSGTHMPIRFAGEH